MKIVLPNPVATVTRTALFHCPHSLISELKHAASFDSWGLDIRFENLVLISVAQVSTSFDQETRVDFSECLIKLKCSVNGTSFLYPAITWVDSEQSLVRGALLGFDKRFAAPDAWSRNSFTDTEMLHIDLDSCIPMEKEGAIASRYSTEYSLPFILFPQIITQNWGMMPSGPCTLDIGSYEATSQPNVFDPRLDTAKCNLLGHELQPVGIWEVNDNFILKRAKPLDLL